VELGLIDGNQEGGDYLDCLEEQENMEEPIKIKQLYMKKDKNKNSLMVLLNILIGKRLKEILNKYALKAGKTII